MTLSSLCSSQAPRLAIGIELKCEGYSRQFLLGVGSRETIMVGSKANSDFPIFRHGIASNHFHIEWHEERVWIVPDCSFETRVDGNLLTVPRIISDGIVVEIAEVRIHVYVNQEPHARRFSSDAETLGWGDSNVAAPVHRYDAPLFPPSCPTTGDLHGEITLFDPIPTSSNADAPPSRALAKASSEPKPPKALHWLKILGALTIRQPRIVWLGGSMIVFSLSAVLSWTFRHFHDVQATTTRHRASNSSALAATRHSPAVSVSVTSEPHQSAAPASIAPAVEPKQALLAQVREAASYLVAGHHADAKRAYLRLAANTPSDPAFVVIAKLLAARQSERCTRPSTSQTSCPDVKP